MMQKALIAIHGQMALIFVQFYNFTLRSVLTLAFTGLLLSGYAQTELTSGRAANSNSRKVICDNITFPGKIGGDQSIHKGDIPEMLFDTQSPSGGTGEIQYLWMEYLQFGSLPGQWYPVLSATSSNYQPGPLYTTRKFMRCATRAGCNTWIESNAVTITVSEIEF